MQKYSRKTKKQQDSIEKVEEKEQKSNNLSPKKKTESFYIIQDWCFTKHTFLNHVIQIIFETTINTFNPYDLLP